MKTLENNRILKESTPFTSYQFGIHEEDLSHIFGALRNQMYSDKILAVIREYSTNAYDAHVVAGIKSTPIRISLPNTLFPEFKVRDYGFGLSEEDVKNVYAWYGCSTKRNDNNTVGQLGFGSKSAFAYGDNFVITSYHGGKKVVYNAVIDTSKKGKISKLHEEDMAPTDKTGVEITVPVCSSDFSQFVTKARHFYAHWDVIPDVAGYDRDTFCVSKKAILETESWKIFSDSDSMSNTRLYALMGNVTYPLNFSILSEKSREETVRQNNTLLQNFLGRNYNSLLIKFDIGDLEISSSRESLQYSEHTLKNIYSKIDSVLAHIKNEVIAKFADQKNIWDAKELYYSYFEQYGANFYGFQTQIGTILNRGVAITSSKFENANRWCNINGHIDDKSYQKLCAENNPAYDAVVSRFSLRPDASGWKVRNASIYSDPDFVARPTCRFVINDIDSPSLIGKCLTAIFEKNYSSVSTVYMIRFKKDGLCNEFINHYNLQDVNIHRLSEVFEEVKTANKRVRRPKSENTRVKVESFTKSTYRRNKFDTEDEIDLSVESGYYLPLFDGQIINDGRRFEFDTVKTTVELLNKHFGQKLFVDKNIVYGFNKRVLESKSFKNNTKNWINLIDYIHSFVKNLITEDYLEYKTYRTFSRNCASCDITISPENCSTLYSMLDDKSTKLAVFLKSASEMTGNKYTSVYELEQYMPPVYTTETNEEMTTKITSLTKEYIKIVQSYPLLEHLSFIRNWKHEAYSIRSEAKLVADYINSIDKTKKSV